jgi:glycosyltransferase involved in cell wall biosynthesis
LIAVIIPAHNEEQHLGACLDSLHRASRCPDLGGEDVRLIVVLDDCSDGTRAIAVAHGAIVLETSSRNVGTARALGADMALALRARWLAFTDADTEVDMRWLSTQLGLSSEAVCGTIAVRDWTAHAPAVQRHFDATYVDQDDHRHVHGANLGLSARAYRRTGGFRSLVTSEDVALVDDLEREGIAIAWSAAPRVFTSARKAFRAPGGFGAALLRAEEESAAAAAGGTA